MKKFLIVLASLFLLTACKSGTPPEFGVPDAESATKVKSDDGIATLYIPDGALPKGVTANDIKIKAIEEDLPAFELLPDGTKFKEPVFLEYDIDKITDTVPVVIIESGGEFAEPDGLQVGFFPDDKKTTIIAKLEHFSAVYTKNGFFKVEIADVSDHFVDDSFTTTITVTKNKPISEKPLKEPIVHNDGSVTVRVWTTLAEDPWWFWAQGLGGGYLKPSDWQDYPSSGRQTSTSASINANWTCIDDGHMNFYNVAYLHYKYKMSSEETDGTVNRYDSDYGDATLWFFSNWFDCKEKITEHKLNCNENTWEDETDLWENWVCKDDCPEDKYCNIATCKCIDIGESDDGGGGTTTGGGGTTTGGGGTTTTGEKRIKALLYLTYYIPLDQLKKWSASDCKCCDEEHWHAISGSVTATDGTVLKDPYKDCGFGKVSQMGVVDVKAP